MAHLAADAAAALGGGGGVGAFLAGVLAGGAGAFLGGGGEGCALGTCSSVYKGVQDVVSRQMR